MTKKIQLSIAILLIAINLTKASYIIEHDSLKHFPEKDFEYLSEYLPKIPLREYTISVDRRQLIMKEIRIGDGQGPNSPPHLIQINEKAIDFYFNDRLYSFNVTYLYEYSLLGFPFIGTIKIRYYFTSSAVYRLTINKEQGFIGSFTVSITVDIISNDNPLASLFGLDNHLNPIIGEAALHYHALINSYLSKHLNERYLRDYGNHTTIIKFPNWGETEVKINNSLYYTDIVENVGLEFYYVNEVDKVQFKPQVVPRFVDSAPKEFMRKINYYYVMFADIIKKPLETVKGQIINSRDINGSTNFRLDKETLKLVFPDIMTKKAEIVNIYMNFTNVKSNIKADSYAHPQIVTFSDILFRFSLHCTLDGKPTILFDSEVSLMLLTAPILEWRLTDMQVSFNLNLTSVRSSIVKLHSITDFFGTVNQNGIPHLMKLYIEEHLIPSSNGVLVMGSGLDIATIFAIDYELSKPIVTERTLEITLYEEPS